ncbi:MAG: hypothetical protein JF618_13675, partial [Leifsonia sp.]|nr:hypothetical protein [Leifsonia sp.]
MCPGRTEGIPSRLSADDTQTSAADFAAPIDEVSADASTGTVDDLSPESAEVDDVSTPSDDTVPVRRSRRVTASSADAAALAAAPATQHVAAADVAADLDKLLPEVTSGAADADSEEGGSSRSRGRNRNRGGGQNGQNAQNGGQNNGGQNGQQNQNAGRQQGGQGQNGGQSNSGQNNGGQQNQNNGPQAEGEGSSRSRYRDRKRGRGGQNDDFEPELSDDDVLIPVAGILDVLDNYAFVRTSGYLPGANDV